MKRSNAPLLWVALVLLAAVGGMALFVLRSSDAPELTAATPGAPAAQESEEELAPADDGVALRAANGLLASGATSVAWPVKLALEQTSALDLPEVEGVAPLGTGRAARLEGRVVNGERGVRGQVEFVAGPNAGRVLATNEAGEYGATDLYPGLNIVRISGAGVAGSLREVRLRTVKGEILSVDYGLPGTMIGTVYGPDGEPLADVEVECDGLSTTTDAQGLFYYPAIPGGTNVVLTLAKRGYARLFQVVGVGSARQMSRDRYQFRMHPEAILEVSMSSAAGAPGPTQVILLPANTQVGRDYPWWKVSPAEVRPGTSLVIEGLPPVKVALRTFHPGAVAVPDDRRVNLRAGGRVVESIRLEPGPKLFGVVRDPQGLAVPGARVALEAPDRVAATLFHLSEMPDFLETEVIPTFPVAAQETSTDSYGRYTLSAWSGGGAMYLMAESADGALWAAEVVGAPEAAADVELDLSLAPREQRRGSLAIEFPSRVQATPVEVVINGDPIDPGLVPADQPLLLEDLAMGTWRVSGVWNGGPLFPAPGYRELEIDGEERLEVHLPDGAIYGQDAETVLRAGEQP